jgi:hypothetical protein
MGMSRIGRVKLLVLGMLIFVSVYNVTLRARHYLPESQTAGGVELFPFFSWSLFTNVRRYQWVTIFRKDDATEYVSQNIRAHKLALQLRRTDPGETVLMNELSSKLAEYAAAFGAGNYSVVVAQVNPLVSGAEREVSREVVLDLGEIQ